MTRRQWRWPLVFLTAAGLAVAAGVAVSPAASASEPKRPLDNDCSGGNVALTFDDGPGPHTRAMLDELDALHVRATFFVVGKNIATGGAAAAELLRAEVADGHSVQNHTYDHASITGASTGTAPLTDTQIKQELTRASTAIVAAGVPKPTLYRPPYGDIDAHADALARSLGYRIVMPWGMPGTNIMDSKDWDGSSTEQIVSNVVDGYTIDGNRYDGIEDGTIVLMHDGLEQETLNAIAALQPIVDHMNAQHLCATTTIRADATGGVVPAPPLPEPAAALNLVRNPSLEQRRGAGLAAEPICFQHAGADLAGTTARWSRITGAHRGVAADQVTVTRWASGDRKLVLSQNTADSSCLAVARPGVRYGTWVWFKGSWPASGAHPATVCVITYYRDATGTWQYWETGTCVDPSNTWKLTGYVTAPLPAGADAVSFGLALSGTGTLVTDDYSLAAQ
ncbi:polysaccharide deacetylase family protein [Actinoplanes sp. NPDC020271]|uniref:polysaccharide deacetylase family protein n=1 Tax=Actinoplanes sp. NPDC020271 TaxID=3363896 RepID=UPI0037B9F813